MQPEALHSLQCVLQPLQGLELPEICCTMPEEVDRRAVPQLLELAEVIQPR